MHKRHKIHVNTVKRPRHTAFSNGWCSSLCERNVTYVEAVVRKTFCKIAHFDLPSKHSMGFDLCVTCPKCAVKQRTMTKYDFPLSQPVSNRTKTQLYSPILRYFFVFIFFTLFPQIKQLLFLYRMIETQFCALFRFYDF